MTMKRLADIGTGGRVVIAAGQTTLPFPPTTYGLVDASWSGGPGIGVVGSLDVFWTAPSAVALTSAVIYAGRLLPAPVASASLTDADVVVATDVFHKVAHGFLTGDGPLPLTFDSGDAMTGLVDGTSYWVIKTDADHLKLASSFANALAGTAVDVDYATRAALDLGSLAAHNLDIVVEAVTAGVAGNSVTFDIVFDAAAGPTLSEVGSAVTLHVKDNVTTNGLLAAVINTSTKVRVKTGTATPAYVLQAATDNFAATSLAVATGTQGFTLGVASANRLFWTPVASPGSISLDANLGAVTTIEHRPDAVAYAASATLGSSVATSVRAGPVMEQGA